MKKIATSMVAASILLSACTTANQPKSIVTQTTTTTTVQETKVIPNYAARLPEKIQTNEKMIVVDPRLHVWGAYDAEGNLIRAGLATAGANWCPDIKRGCRTSVGSFRIKTLGNAACKSSRYPIPHGGAPMPYCMFFNGDHGLHGSPDSKVVEGNASHGCVRMHVQDAQWVRQNFATIGTKVVVKPY